MKRKTTAKEVLSSLHTLRERRYVGDLSASDTLIDLSSAIKDANLTERQIEALELVYVKDLTQKRAGEQMGVGQNTVSMLISRAVEAIYDAMPQTFEEVTKMGKPEKVFNVRATDDVVIEIEEMKRIPCVIFGKVPDNARVVVIPNSTTARWTNLQLLERKFDGSVTLINMSNPDHFVDCIEGHPDGSYTETSLTDDGELLDTFKLNSVDFKYEVQDVPYLVRKGDVVARVEVYND